MSARPSAQGSATATASDEFDSRLGTLELAIPKLCQGSYFPDWLLEPRRRAERALVAVIQEAYVRGVSTRRVDDLVRAMGAAGISKSQVSRLVGELDGELGHSASAPSTPSLRVRVARRASRQGARGGTRRPRGAPHRDRGE